MGPSDKYPVNFFAANIKLLKLGGLWVPEESASTFLCILYMVYNSICIGLCQIYHTPAEIFMLQYTLRDLSKAVEHVGLITTHLLGTYKLINWFVYRKRYLKIMTTLNDPDFQYASFGDSFKPGEQTAKEMAFSAFITYGLNVAGNGVPISKSLPVVGMLSYIDREFFANGTLTCDDFMPYFSWIPFSRATRDLCIGAILFQAIPVMIFAWQIIAHDSLFAAMLNGISVHFENLKGAFGTLRGRCLEQLNLKDQPVLHDVDVLGLEQRMYDELRKCTIHLQTILFLAEDMERLFTYITLGQVLITLSVFVSRMFLITSVGIFSNTFAAEMVYLTAVACQCAAYCFFGSQITFKSSELPQAIFSSDWLSASVRFKKGLLMNMLRMKKPIFLTVGKFSPLTLQTLISIIKGSYSYFAVLNSAKR